MFLVPTTKKQKTAIKEGISLDRCYESVDELIKAELALPAGKRMEVVAIVTPNAQHYPVKETAFKWISSGM